MNNLFANLPAALPVELVTVLAENSHVRIERILSTGQSSPAGYWYDQAEHEWGVVLKGAARLEFQDAPVVHLTPGDSVLIPAHQRHRVAWTTPDEPTVWLAVFYRD